MFPADAVRAAARVFLRAQNAAGAGGGAIAQTEIALDRLEAALAATAARSRHH
jgi:hypothetical protein